MVVRDTVFRASYEILQSNGPDCAPACQVTADSLVIDEARIRPLPIGEWADFYTSIRAGNEGKTPE